MRYGLASALLAALTLIQGCGGGGGGGGDAAAPAPTPAAAPSAVTTVSTAANVHPISVNPGLSNNINLAFTSVTLCAPGSSTNCQTIDNIVVDTGSSGLRVLSSALSATLGLRQQVDAGGTPLIECAHFVDGYAWGPVKLADLKLSGELASSLPIQVMGDPNYPGVPTRCAATGPSKNSVQELRANGILGVSVFRQDCGSACTLPNNRGLYYACLSPFFCAQAAVPLAQQVQNPVSMFAVNNNGVIIQLPSVPAVGAATVSGSLVFGIGTQSNNAIGAATVLGVNPANGNFTTLYKGSSYTASFLDSGSNGLFISDSIAVCGSATAAPGFYCPASTINGSAVLQGTNGTSATVDFSIADVGSLLAANPGFSAFANVGAPFLSNSFDWGLPFFYGRNVYTAIEGAGTPAGPGPYVAF
ncbi:MAG: DUF3443 domain-containing protein [Burkholderiales bacterium]|nr:DUF3443 domain-containing protein [Burkholderiales bacterium]